jgi:hypothetical protein
MLPKILKAFPPINPDILYSQALFPIPVHGATAFALRFSPKHTYSPTSGRFKPEKLQLKQEWAQNRWNERKEPFWWSAVPKRETAHHHATVRSWMSRRMRNAVVESLKKEGFKPDGTRLEGRYGGPLYGTAHFTPQTTILKMPYTELVKQTDAAVKRMMNFRVKKMESKVACAESPKVAKKEKRKK